MKQYLQSACAALALSSSAPALSQESNDLTAVLNFEVPLENGVPRGWLSELPETVSLDDEIIYAGEFAVRIDRDNSSQQRFTGISHSIPIEFSGNTIELNGVLRTQDVTGFAGFWLRQDGPTGAVAFENMQQREIDGTRGWTQYRVLLPLMPAADRLVFGVLLEGEGTVWADQIELLVDGVPIHQAPRLIAEETVLDTDTEFLEGSDIIIETLSSPQLENLVLLAKIWGFAKYHHPIVAGGGSHWDFELFRILPAMLELTSVPERNAALLNWLQRFGELDACDSCATGPANFHLSADVDWIDDAGLLGRELSAFLRQVYENRIAAGAQFYVGTRQPGALNVLFEHEPAYEHLTVPDSGYRLLSLFRFWNSVTYWFPYRDVIGEPWDGVLREFVPVFAGAGSRDDYISALLRLTARVNDTHVGLTAGADLIPPRGACYLPVKLRFIEERAVVAGYAHTVLGPASGLAFGDVILGMDGRAVENLIDEWAPFYSASNRPVMLRNMTTFATRGACGPAELSVLRDGAMHDVEVSRIPVQELDNFGLLNHDRGGETFQWLTEDVAYLNLRSITADAIESYISELSSAQGLVIDIRNYPMANVMFLLGRHLVATPTPFARFSRPDLSNPGAFIWGFEATHQPAPPYFGGRIAILVDEVTQSAAEYTAMAMRAAPGAIVVGSTTAGADGNVSQIPLPGGVGSRFSGLGVFYPDGSPTQRVGIVPDVYVTPTVAGIRDRRDEVLERALIEIVGSGLDAETVRDIARLP